MEALTVASLQRLGLGFNPDEDAAREALRRFQNERGLLVTGALDEPTRLALDAIPTEGLVPEWWGTEEQDEAVAARLGASDEASIRRFQSARRLPLTGVVDEATAVALGG